MEKTEKEELLTDAKSRQVYDPIEKKFDYSKRRVTHLKGENTKIYLPKLGELKDESELEMIRNILMAEYRNYKADMIKKKIKEKTARKEKFDKEKLFEKNQEWDNLSAMEKNSKKTRIFHLLI